MKVKTTMNQQALSKLAKAPRQALEMTGQQVLNDVRDEQTMPFDEGTLQNDSTFLDTTKSSRGQVSVVSDTPYARRLYYHPEYNFQQGKNPNAGAGWFDPYATGNKVAKVKHWFKQFTKRNGGGYIK